jgi:RimJ/RimL family protein N-acetyltransferase
LLTKRLIWDCSAAHSNVRLIKSCSPGRRSACNDSGTTTAKPVAGEGSEGSIEGSNPFVVRRVQSGDLPAVADLYELVAGEGRHIGAELPVDKPARIEKWRGCVDADDACMFVALAGDEVIGSAGVFGTGVVDLGINVAREWRGRGIGSALLEACIEWARRAGAHKMTLQVWPHNVAALTLYRKFGFVQEGYLRRHWRRRNGELWDAIVMGLLLEEH